MSRLTSFIALLSLLGIFLYTPDVTGYSDKSTNLISVIRNVDDAGKVAHYLDYSISNCPDTADQQTNYYTISGLKLEFDNNLNTRYKQQAVIKTVSYLLQWLKHTHPRTIIEEDQTLDILS